MKGKTTTHSLNWVDLHIYTKQRTKAIYIYK